MTGSYRSEKYLIKNKKVNLRIYEPWVLQGATDQTRGCVSYQRY